MRGIVTLRLMGFQHSEPDQLPQSHSRHRSDFDASGNLNANAELLTYAVTRSRQLQFELKL